MALAKWIKDSFGDTFKQLSIWEEVVKLKEKHFEENPSAKNKSILNKVHAEFVTYLKLKRIFEDKRLGCSGLLKGIGIQDSFII